MAIKFLLFGKSDLMFIIIKSNIFLKLKYEEGKMEKKNFQILYLLLYKYIHKYFNLLFTYRHYKFPTLFF